MLLISSSKIAKDSNCDIIGIGSIIYNSYLGCVWLRVEDSEIEHVEEIVLVKLMRHRG